MPALPRTARPAAEAKADEGDDLPGLVPRRVRKYDLIYVTSQLSIMVETGITLSVALGSIAQEEQNPTLRRILNDLKRALNRETIFRRPFPSIRKSSIERISR